MKDYMGSSSSSSGPATLLPFQELRNIRSYLYSAAEHYELAYLHSEQKLLVLESLKDYSTKAFVNALDHIGTGASQLNDSLTHHAAECSSLETRLSVITQRITTCHEHMIFGGLHKWQKHRRWRQPLYNKHYKTSLEETLRETPPDAEQCDLGVPRTLSWYLSTGLSPFPPSSVQRNRHRSSSPAPREKMIGARRSYSRSLSSEQIFMFTHDFGASWRAHVKDPFMCRSSSLLSLMMSEEMELGKCQDKMVLPSSQEEDDGKNRGSSNTNDLDEIISEEDEVASS